MTGAVSHDAAVARARALPIWSGPVAPQLLGGGITNRNFLVEDGGRRFVVRIGDDIPVHQILRFNELAASRAAHAAGLSPAVIHAGPGALVLDHLEARPLTPQDLRADAMLARVAPLIRGCHREVPRYLRGPVLMFWVFHVLRDYAATLRDGDSAYLPRLQSLMAAAERLEAAVGPIDVVFGHNDLLAANVLDDGARLWLIDWDYAGFNSPLFDIGGLAANNGLSVPQERWLLETVLETTATDALWHRYQAMKCAAVLRESLWSMVSEIHSALDFDYASYTRANLARFDAAHAAFSTL